ncbi:MAG: hypothetical protein ACR2NG_05195 [Acidimicrobiia bacterium]
MVLRMIALALCAAVLAAACTSGGDEDASAPESTAATLAPTTTVPSTEAPSTTTSTLAALSTVTPPQYQIVSRAPVDEDSTEVGDEVVVLLDSSTYDSLSDIDIFDVIVEVVELFPPITVLHVVDDAAAANVVTDPDASEEAREILDDHYLARLDEGFTITYLGPFASSGTAVLGS